jgi:choline dehydrogenase-like flavoprotein
VKRFDVLVLGGGAAGCVLAARLSEDTGRSICLVEAGPDYGPFDADRWPAEMVDARNIPSTHDWETATDERGTARAKIIGGCSAHNACLVLRGTDADYDEWGHGWSGLELAPHLDRAEAELQTQPAIADDAPPWHAATIEAARSLGLEARPYRANAVDGVRWNAAFAYLDVARPRSNLTIRPEAHVDRLLLRGGRALGAVLAGGEELRAKMAVVACGTYGSPAVLLRSGVGPGLRVDLPVGESLIDHPGVNVEWEAAADIAPPDGQASYGLVLPEPDLQLVPWASPRDGGASVPALLAFLMKPRSTGRLTLQSDDPLAPPLIAHRHLSDERDVGPVIRAVELARQVAATEPVASLVARETAPGEMDVERYVRENVRGYYHPVGTCAIGRVVDGQLRVLGVEGLYVADASVIPTIPRANTHLTTVAIAERAATWI